MTGPYGVFGKWYVWMEGRLILRRLGEKGLRGVQPAGDKKNLADGSFLGAFLVFWGQKGE